MINELILPAGLMIMGIALAGYFLGAIPFGLVLTRLAGYGDIRTIGSGNIGATNVLRTGNKPLALATLILDSGKAALAAGLAWWFFGHEAGLIAGFAAVIGHNFPIWLGFRGGKGVATTFGVLLVVAWPVGISAVLTWLAIALGWRISSLAALISLALSPLYAWVYTDIPTSLTALALALLGMIRHHRNIYRICRGEEPKIGRKEEV